MTRLLRRPVVIGGILALAVAVPFVITAIALSHPKPYVVLDLAQTEMRVREVFTLHPPLIGLPGRIGHYLVHTGSHPGPASFFALAPFYKIFGSTPWALFVAALSVNFTWILVALWIGYRRVGRAGLLGVGLGVLLLIHTFGMFAIEQPWNPYLPLMAWTVVLLAAWSVLLDDAPMLPVLAVSATYCMQIHLPYLGLAGGMVGATILFSLISTWMRSRRAAASPSEVDEETAEPAEELSSALRIRSGQGVPDMGRLLRWGAFAAVLAAALWSPPIWQQFRAQEGNFTLIWGDLAHPPEAAGGLGQGLHLMFTHLNVPELLRGHATRYVSVASVVPGIVLFPIWLGSVFVAWRGRMRRVLHLHLVLAVGLVLGVISLAKIFGDLYWYLMMWAWTLGVLMVAVILWTAFEWFRVRAAERAENGSVLRLDRAVTGVAMVGVALLFVAVTLDASHAKIPNQPLSNQMARVVPEMISAIRAGDTPNDRKTGLFVVTWNDPVNIGSPGYTVLDELQRHGIKSGLLPMFRGIVTDNELVPPGTERGIVHVAVGRKDIDAWRQKPGAREVAYYDGRTKAEVAEFARLRTETIKILEKSGDDPSIVDNSLVGGSLTTKLPQSARTNMSIMGDIGLPVAIFLAAPGTP